MLTRLIHPGCLPSCVTRLVKVTTDVRATPCEGRLRLASTFVLQQCPRLSTTTQAETLIGSALPIYRPKAMHVRESIRHSIHTNQAAFPILNTCQKGYIYQASCPDEFEQAVQSFPHFVSFRSSKPHQPRYFSLTLLDIRQKFPVQTTMSANSHSSMSAQGPRTYNDLHDELRGHWAELERFDSGSTQRWLDYRSSRVCALIQKLRPYHESNKERKCQGTTLLSIATRSDKAIKIASTKSGKTTTHQIPMAEIRQGQPKTKRRNDHEAILMHYLSSNSNDAPSSAGPQNVVPFTGIAALTRRPPNSASSSDYVGSSEPPRGHQAGPYAQGGPHVQGPSSSAPSAGSYPTATGGFYGSETPYESSQSSGAGQPYGQAWPQTPRQQHASPSLAMLGVKDTRQAPPKR